MLNIDKAQWRKFKYIWYTSSKRKGLKEHSKYSSNGHTRHSGEKSNASVLQISDTRHQLYSGMTNIQHIMPNIDKTQWRKVKCVCPANIECQRNITHTTHNIRIHLDKIDYINSAFNVRKHCENRSWCVDGCTLRNFRRKMFTQMCEFCQIMFVWWADH